MGLFGKKDDPMKKEENKLKKEGASKKALKCDQCPYVPKNFTDFLKHLEEKHPDGGKPSGW